MSMEESVQEAWKHMEVVVDCFVFDSHTAYLVG